MEHLTKSQLVLLAVFVSFVTSIAASIVTTAQLSRNAPVATSPVIQTVNRVIEKVIPVPTPVAEDPKPASDPTPQPSSEDLLVRAIERNAGSFTDVVLQGAEASAIVRGIAVGEQTLLVPASTLLTTERYVRGAEGAFALSVATTTASGFAVATVGERIKLRSDTSTSTPEKTPMKLAPIALSSGALPRVGQAVIVMSGEDGGTADYGIVSSVIERAHEGEAPTHRIKVSVPLAASDVGKTLVNPATGDVLGVVAQEGSNVWVVPAADIRALLAPPAAAQGEGEDTLAAS